MNKDSDSLTLVFVYAGDSGLFNAVVHYAHKILSPRTYECQLCMLTSGALGTEKAWTEFLRELALPVVFLHRDELIARDKTKAKDALPIVYAERGGALTPIVTAAQINACADLQSLISAVRTAVDGMRRPEDRVVAATASLRPAAGGAS